MGSQIVSTEKEKEMDCKHIQILNAQRTAIVAFRRNTTTIHKSIQISEEMARLENYFEMMAENEMESCEPCADISEFGEEEASVIENIWFRRIYRNSEKWGK